MDQPRGDSDRLCMLLAGSPDPSHRRRAGRYAKSDDTQWELWRTGDSEVMRGLASNSNLDGFVFAALLGNERPEVQAEMVSAFGRLTADQVEDVLKMCKVQGDAIPVAVAEEAALNPVLSLNRRVELALVSPDDEVLKVVIKHAWDPESVERLSKHNPRVQRVATEVILGATH